MEFIENKNVLKKIQQYSTGITEQLLAVRELIKQVAKDCGDDNVVEETLKWAEPSYITKNGSTIRINRYKDTEDIAVYFNCQSSLVETCREIYGDCFEYEAKRALVLKADQPLPEIELSHCIQLALTYHKVKHLPLLGA